MASWATRSIPGGGRWGRGCRKPIFVVMSTEELRSEILKKLDEVPDAILLEILEYLRGFQAKTPEEQKRVLGLRRVLEGKRDLLLRLAQ